MDYTYLPQITLGEVIEIAVATIVVVAALIGWAVHQWRLGHAFTVLFQLDPFELDALSERREQTAYREIWACPKQIRVLLRVKPNKGTRFDRIGVRIVRRKWVWLTVWQQWWILWRPRVWMWINVPQDMICIDAISDVDIEKRRCPSGQKFETWNDLAGGYWAEYIPPFIRAVEDSIWLDITATVNHPDEYHISFQGRIVDERRGYSRRTFILEDVRPKNYLVRP